MATMTAFRLTGGQPAAGFCEVPVPVPGDGEVLVRVAGVGLCGTDLHFLDDPAAFPYELPFTLGHENAGWVEAVGPGVDALRTGDPVVVSSGSFCGRCPRCRRGQTNGCANRGWVGRGFGADGGLAGFMVAPERELVRLGSLDPRRAGPLTDAGATSYHAVRIALPKLLPGATAVVIGVGGLGSFAVQYLKLLSPARVVAADISDRRLDHARALGADETLPSDRGTHKALRELTDGDGAAVVLDFVGTDDTMRTALRSAAPMGSIVLVGVGGGSVAVGQGLLPPGCEVTAPMSSTISDLQDVVSLAEAGSLRIDVDLFPFDRIMEAFARFRAGELAGRAVVTPAG